MHVLGLTKSLTSCPPQEGDVAVDCLVAARYSTSLGNGLGFCRCMF